MSYFILNHKCKATKMSKSIKHHASRERLLKMRQGGLCLALLENYNWCILLPVI
jgi:hypothetical protein